MLVRENSNRVRPQDTSLPYPYLLGVRVDRLRLPDLLHRVRTAVVHRCRTTVLYVNVHCLNVAEHDEAYLSTLLRADIVYCDGTGVRLGARLAGQRIPERMTGADWIVDLCRLAVREDFSFYLFGDRPLVVDCAARVLRRAHPGLRIVGTSPGYDVSDRVVQEINATQPDILLVGMGTPGQERWIAVNREALDVPVVWAVGALFGFVSGTIPRGPHWMTAHGLEWLCRLAAEPRKLWRRYLIGIPYFLWRIVKTYRLG